MNKLNHLTILILLILFSTTAFAGREMEFHIKELERTDLPDTTRINYLKFLFYEFAKYDDDIALEYGKKLIDFTKSKSIKIDEKLEFDYGKSLIGFGHYNEGYKYASSLLKKYKSKGVVNNVLKAESLIALQYYKKGYISKSISHYKQNISTAIKFENFIYAANTLYDLANIYLDIGESKEEFETLLKAYEYYVKSKEENTETLVYIQHRPR